MTEPPSALLDPGSQAERTRLSWRRTALSLVVTGLAGVRWAVESRSPWVALVACGLLVCAGALSGLSARRYLRSWDLWASAAVSGVRPPGARTMATCSLLLVLSGVAAATAEILS